MTLSDIKNKIYFYTKSNLNSLPDNILLILINNAYERVASLIRQSDGRWEWQDDNQTGPPNASYTITSGTQNYAIATTILSIDRVELKDSNGNWSVLQPIDKSDFSNTNLNEYFGSSGIPAYYDKVGDELYLYPSPNYTQATSLKIFFRSGPTLFTASDLSTGTAVPGFNSLYHDLIALWASYYVAISTDTLKNANYLLGLIKLQESALMNDYATRNKDEKKRLTMKNIDFR